MRVITGTAKGRTLRTLEGDNVRPTTQRVKEAIFSIIQFDIEGRRVLDLFAGSGQLGIEALSRGAEQAVFVDNEKASVAVIKENLAKTQLASKASVVQTDALSFLRMNGELFDIAFLDPPYSTGLLEKAMSAISDHIATGGIVICECPLGEEPDDEIGSLVKNRSYRYGKISVTTFIKQ
ncbi:MAG: 16S rRNA (guanine(966)-N(2))-methyltransferase RsmD [Clostridia bacterium]|nr:16S rRNA (guanine(966)-N(2))-methyltransferase RsmD [Clostridia bacterium]